MATSVPAGVDPSTSVELNQALTRGGISVARITPGAPGLYFAAPQDERRTYIAFSLVNAAQGGTVSPGDDNAPNGYNLSVDQPIIEFGGTAMAAIVKAKWWFFCDVVSSIDVTVFRS